MRYHFARVALTEKGRATLPEAQLQPQLCLLAEVKAGNAMQLFEYHRPSSLSEAAALLERHGTDARLLAGGTDLTVGLRHHLIAPKVVIDLKRINDIAAGIEITDGSLRISAKTTMAKLVRNALVQHHFPALVESADVVGSPQIRNRATLIGNICNASPAADTVPVLCVYGASVIVYGKGGEREVPVVDFIQGNRKIDLQRGELVVAVKLPIPKTAFGAAFDRVTRRRGVDLATVNLCCGIGPSGRAVLALGAVSPRPLLLEDADGAFSNIDAAAAERMAGLDGLVGQAAPISDVRASADYRRAMLKVLAERTLARAQDRLQEWGQNV